jgi:hypothetical protein
MAGFCEGGNKTSGSTKGGKSLDYVSLDNRNDDDDDDDDDNNNNNNNNNKLNNNNCYDI